LQENEFSFAPLNDKPSDGDNKSELSVENEALYCIEQEPEPEIKQLRSIKTCLNTMFDHETTEVA
jgi:hypothetical protein